MELYTQPLLHPQKQEGATSEENDLNMITWVLGIVLLTFALFMSARMGIYQECLYQKHGKHPREALFFIVSYANNVI